MRNPNSLLYVNNICIPEEASKSHFLQPWVREYLLHLFKTNSLENQVNIINHGLEVSMGYSVQSLMA